MHLGQTAVVTKEKTALYSTYHLTGLVCWAEADVVWLVSRLLGKGVAIILS